MLYYINVELNNNNPQASKMKNLNANNTTLKKRVFPLETNNVPKYYFENDLNSNSFLKKAVTPAAFANNPIKIESN